MLNFLKLNSPQMTNQSVQQWDPLKDTWLVSDLKSKHEIQGVAVKKFGYYTDDAIMRISDFWRMWIRRLDPTLKVVGSDFIKTLVQNFVDRHGSKLELLEGETPILYRALQEFSPILLHPNSREVIEEWIELEYKKNAQQKKWHKWYQISRVCLRYILEEHGAIDGKWSAAYLQSQHLEKIIWPRKIFVDVGSELSSIEMGLFRAMAAHTEIYILSPDPIWKNKFQNILSVYSDSFGYGKTIQNQSDKVFESGVPEQNFVRLSTQLAEVKFAVAKVRQWLDAGVSAEKISIISSDIERFWPVLRLYLDEEGISYKKEVVAQMNSLGDVQNFLAVLKNYSGEVAWDSLERDYFGKEIKSRQNFEKFKALFYQLYDAEDLSRDSKVKELYFQKIDFSSEIERDEFVSFMMKIWIEIPESVTKADLFESIFKDFLSQSLNIKLKISRWISFLKNRLTAKEVKLQKKSIEGIHIDSLMSLQLSEVTHKIYIGLNEELYAKRNMTLMSQADSLSLKKNFDLSIDCSEESSSDFQIRWQYMAADENTFYTSAHLSFEADPLNASLFFIEKRPVSAVEAPALTRADEIQLNYLFPENIPDVNGLSKGRLVEDMVGLQSELNLKKFNSLTVSDFENYAKCSFKLLAGKAFRLRDYSQVGIDLDPRHKGSLAHAMFEHLIRNRNLQNVKSSDLENFLDEKRTELNLYPAKDEFWKVQRTRLIASAGKFIEFEKTRIHLFDSKVEQELNIYFDLELKNFSSEEPKKGFKFSMRVDRLDIHKEKKFAVIYDYKSSDYGLKPTAKWISEKQFQMLLYLKAVKLTLPPEIKTAGALYYLYRKMNFSKGLIQAEVGYENFEMRKSNKSALTEDEIHDIENEFTNLTYEVLSRLEVGEIKNQPYNINECAECDWRKMCRATHLM